MADDLATVQSVVEVERVIRMTLRVDTYILGAMAICPSNSLQHSSEQVQAEVHSRSWVRAQS